MEHEQDIITPTPQKKTRPRKRRTTTTRSERPEASAESEKKGEQLMLVNITAGEECRIAILHNRKLEELYIERASSESHVGNIYKGRVTNVEPSIQAAFVDFGLGKNGFLHISDLQPQYFPDGRNEAEDVGRKTPRRERPPIQKCLRRGQEVIVQITKEGIGTKGPTLTTYISLPGRYLVLMPGMSRLGVSRKIEDDEARRKMRDVLNEIDMPKNMGVILRTAGLDRTKRELQRDLQYLQRLWKAVATRIRNDRTPTELYQESDLVIRTIRDVYTSDFAKIIVDDEQVAQKARDFISIVSPRKTDAVEVYSGPLPLFHQYGVEAEIERINSRHVPLKSGGSLVIDSTEALVAIDVNSGKYRDLDDAEETAHRINLEAAEEISRQLRLRDLGGVIVIDFIDMRLEKNRRDVEHAMREALKKQKERAKVLRMSQFGIIELTRQRQRPSIKRSIYHDCPYCKGAGLVKTYESMSLDVIRTLRMSTQHQAASRVIVSVHTQVAFDLLNRKRNELAAIEASHNKTILIRGEAGFGLDECRIEYRDVRDRIVEPGSAAPPAPVPVPEPRRHEEPRPAPASQPQSRAPSHSQAGEDSAQGQQQNPNGSRRRRRRRGGRRRRGNANGNGHETTQAQNGAAETPSEDADSFTDEIAQVVTFDDREPPMDDKDVIPL